MTQVSVVCNMIEVNGGRLISTRSQRLWIPSEATAVKGTENVCCGGWGRSFQMRNLQGEVVGDVTEIELL